MKENLLVPSSPPICPTDIYDTITFCLSGDEEVLVLSKEGFTYKGELIQDAGKAYKLFIEFLNK